MKHWIGAFVVLLMLCSSCQSAPDNRWQLMENARGALAEENYLQAVGYFDRLVVIEPENAEVFNGRGVAKLEQQKYQDALEDLEKAVQLDSTNAIYWYNLGLCRCCLADYEGGVKAFNQALVLDPEHAESLCQRGAAYAHLGEYELAEQDIEVAGVLSPQEHGAFWAALGSAYVSDGNYIRAEEAFNQAILLDENNPELYLQRADVYMLTKEYEKAQEDLVQAIGMQESFLAGYELLGDLYYVQKEYEQAIANYSVALLEQADYLGYLNRGSCYQALGRYVEAEADFTAAIMLEPRNAAAYDCRGQVREMLDNIEGAKKDYKIAKDILEEGAKEDGK